jgi:hypothetical protein
MDFTRLLTYRSRLYVNVNTDMVGNMWWYKHGKFHRDGNKPAVICFLDNTWWYYYNGEIHREDDQPAISLSRQHCTPGKFTLAWYYRGKPHRDNKPAIVTENGGISWYNHGIKIK